MLRPYKEAIGYNWKYLPLTGQSSKLATSAIGLFFVNISIRFRGIHGTPPRSHHSDSFLAVELLTG